MTTIFYKVDYKYVINLKNQKKHAYQKKMISYSIRDLGEMLFVGDILIKNEKTKDYLVLKEISLVRFFYQFISGLNQVKSTQEASFSDEANFYEIKMKLNKGILEIKDLDFVKVKHKALVKEIKIVWLNFIQ